MSILCFSIILLSITFTRCAKESIGYFDLNDADQHVHVMQLIISKLSGVLEESAEVNKKFDALKNRFNDLDQNVNKISQMYTKLSVAISKQVEDQESLVKSSLSAIENVNKRTDEMEMRLNRTAIDLIGFESDMSTVKEQNDIIKKNLSTRVADINHLLKQSSTDIESFKTSISRTVEEHSVALRHDVNETLQNQDMQNNGMKLLWEQNSLKAQTDWHMILRRQDGSLDFNRNWTEYKNGFGDLTGEFFVGLEVLHRLTSNGLRHELLIQLTDADNNQTIAKYDNLEIGSEQEKYVLKKVGDHSGDAEDALSHHIGEKFTTFDEDNDMAAGENCAQTLKGPWWFYRCYPSSNLFGPYHWHELGYRLRWGPSILKNLKSVEVKVRQA